MRKVVIIFFLVAAGIATFLALLAVPSPTPLELKLVSAKPIGCVNGKNYMLLTVNIINRSRISITHGWAEDVQSKVQGQWIDVDQGFDLSWVSMGQSIQKRFCVLEGAEAFRLRFHYYVDYQQPVSPRQQMLEKLGPWAVSLVRKSPPLRKWIADELEPGQRQMTLDVEIPPRAGTSD